MTTADKLDDRYRALDGTIRMTGIQALARLPVDVRRADLDAGRRTAAFVSGYEGSPLAGYDLELGRCAELLDEHDVVFRPAVNEELAATAVQGTQLVSAFDGSRVDGVVGFWYGKSPGLDRASDALRHNNLAGVDPNGGALILVGDDPAAKSSTVPGASEQLLADLGVPVLYPADAQEILELGHHAVAMSRQSGLWVALKIATNVADGTWTVDLDEANAQAAVARQTIIDAPSHQPTMKLVQPTLSALEASRNGSRLNAAREYAARAGLTRVVTSSPDDRVAVLSSGKTFRDTHQALREMGLDDEALRHSGIRLIDLKMIHPLDVATLSTLLGDLDHVFVVEEKRAFVEAAIKDLFYGVAKAPGVFGKRGPVAGAGLPDFGELDPTTIARALRSTFSEWGVRLPAGATAAVGEARETRLALPLVTRTPYFCSGCPHNSSTKTPAGSAIGAGIGCHAMVTLMDRKQVGDITGLTQMGGEGAQWIGLSPFVVTDHLIQNLGDGTFHHSGSLAVRAAVASGVNITYKLLYNSAVAMTGGQQAVGVMSVRDITRELMAEGVQQVIITTEDPKRYRRVRLPRGVKVLHRDLLVQAQEQLARVKGTTVLIHDQECATEVRRKRKRGLAPMPRERVMINEAVCEGCGDCGEKSNCLSVQPVQTELGRKTRIDQSSCNIDLSCLKGDCPSFLTVIPAKNTGTTRRVVAARLAVHELPEPARRSTEATHTTRLLGIGGTGIVTLSQILSQAAALDGLPVAALDQTGLAQKGGAVVSDVKIGGDVQKTSNKAGEGEVDLYLAADVVVGADPRHLLAASTERTVAIVSTAQVPTGLMVADSRRHFPEVRELVRRIAEATRPGTNLSFNAHEYSRRLLGDEAFANLFLTGVAYQAGLLPVTADSLERAVTLNGVKIEQNTQAFRRGRQFVADRDAFDATLAGLAPSEHVATARRSATAAAIAAPFDDPGLRELVGRRATELIQYQNVGYARRFISAVEQVRRAEERIDSTRTELSTAAANTLYQLMAYKDEYEVARLLTCHEATAAVEAEFGPGAKVVYRLHPPLLRALGLRQKLRLGPWFRPALLVLHRLRWLRGTWADPFGYAEVRRVERGLIREYEQMLQDICARATRDTYDAAVEVASLPSSIRGYESIKLRSVAEYREKLGQHTRFLTDAESDRSSSTL